MPAFADGTLVETSLSLYEMKMASLYTGLERSTRMLQLASTDIFQWSESTAQTETSKNVAVLSPMPSPQSIRSIPVLYYTPTVAQCTPRILCVELSMK